LVNQQISHFQFHFSLGRRSEMTNTRHHPGHDRRFAVGVLQFALLCLRFSDAEVIDRIAATDRQSAIMQKPAPRGVARDGVFSTARSRI